MLRAVFFDLGDTLQHYHVEDWDQIVAELNKDLYDHLVDAGHGHRMPPLDSFLEFTSTTMLAHRQDMARTNRSHALREVLELFFADQGIHDLEASNFMQPWYRRISELTYCPEDVKPTLELLKERGLKLGLISNTGWTSDHHDPDLERFGLKDLLNCRMYSCEVGWEKPAPQIFKAAMECLGVEPQEAVMVGDFLRYDVAGAHGVGMKGIWKQMDNRPYEADDHSIVPDAIIRKIGELLEVLKGLAE